MIHGQMHNMDTEMTRSVPFPQYATLHAAIDAFPEALGLRFVTETSIDEADPDQTLSIAWDGGRKVYRIHAQRIHRVEDLGRLRAKLPPTDDTLLLTPCLTEGLARKCVELGLPFLDAAGNAFLTGPGLRVLLVGNRLKGAPKRFAAVPPFQPYNRKGLQVVFALLAGQGLAGATYRVLAKAAGVATGTVGLVMADLTEAGLVAPTPAGRIILHPERLMDGWMANFPHKLRPHLHPSRFRAATPQGWKDLDLRGQKAQWGGEIAADRLTHDLQPLTATIYTRENPARLASALRLRPDPQGDIEILDGFWDFPNPQGVPEDIVPPLLVYIDLVASGDPRNIDIARILHAKYLHPIHSTP